MEIIIKNGDELSLTNVPDGELDLVKSDNEVITSFNLSEEEKEKIYNGCILNSDFTITETPTYNDTCKCNDLQEFSKLESDILKINESLKTCTAYKDAGNCPQSRMDRILLQEADLLKRKSDAETLRNNKLDYLIETYSDGTTEGDMLIIEEVNNILLGNI